VTGQDDRSIGLSLTRCAASSLKIVPSTTARTTKDRPGRRAVISDRRAHVWRLSDNGLDHDAIAQRLGVSVGSVRRYLREPRLDEPARPWLGDVARESDVQNVVNPLYPPARPQLFASLDDPDAYWGETDGANVTLFGLPVAVWLIAGGLILGALIWLWHRWRSERDRH
jgi:hypothetical protein